MQVAAAAGAVGAVAVAVDAVAVAVDADADADADVAVAGGVAAGVVADSCWVVGIPLHAYVAGSSVEPLAAADVAVGSWHLTRLAGRVSMYGPRKALKEIDVAVPA